MSRKKLKGKSENIISAERPKKVQHIRIYGMQLKQWLQANV